VVENALADGSNLFRSLALAEDDFREAVTQVAVVIDLGKGEVFIREIC